MPRYLAIYNGAADEQARSGLDEQRQTEFLAAWAAWAAAHRHALVDTGAPLDAKKRVTADGVQDFTDAKTGYAVVEADSHDDAVRIFAEHPHLGLCSGNSIDVLECPPVPG